MKYGSLKSELAYQTVLQEEFLKLLSTFNGSVLSHYEKFHLARTPAIQPSSEQQTSTRMAETLMNVKGSASDGCNEEEEFWPTPALLTGHKTHTIRFGTPRKNESRILRYKSMSSDELTPLDMTYGTNSSEEEDPFRDDEFYDGTGNLMWMAAICFGHLVFQEVEPLRSYLLRGIPKGERKLSKCNERRRFCELGCGTGGAGISLLLSALGGNPRNDTDTHDSGKYHVVFTDNDAESLELCASNCELNGLDPESYSHQLLGWGKEHLENIQQQEDSNEGLGSESFDVVFATDVIYDLKMIAPLFETVDFLLKQGKNDSERGGHLVLSHVPRFCIPKDTSQNMEDQNPSSVPEEDSPSEAFLELEHFIKSEANKVGLVLVETIRPHNVLSEEGLALSGDDDDSDNEEDSMQQLTLETMKDAHAVVFVFERS